MRTFWNASTASVAIAMSVGFASPAYAQSAPAADDTSGTAINDIVVTATRREELLNSIPIAVQALSGDTLQDLNITNFDKLIEFLPNVQAASQGPGTSAIYIRGLSTDTPGLQIVGTAGAAPNVALYLNDAPAATPGRNLDVYAADLQRVEVLAGPQGTLFGASSMGGAVRYITNKPDLNAFHAGFTGTYAMTKGGDDSVAGQAFINIPVIEDRFAVRLVVYNDQQGGYIDNGAGTYQMPFNGHVGEAGRLPEGNPLLVRRALESCTGVVNCTGSTYRAPIRQKINNDRFVEDNFNDASYIGGRLAATFKLSDDWAIDVMHLRQRLKTDGVFNYEPGVGDLKVTQFNPNSLRDDVDLTTLTIKGRLGFLDLIYSGSYLNRNSVQKADYASYSNIGLYLPYYECDKGIYYTAAYNGNIGNTCYTPSKSYQVRNKNQRYTQELRVSTPSTGRIRATAGVFYDVNKLYDNTDWSYLQQSAGFIYQRRANPAVNAYDTNLKPIAVGFFNDVQRRDRQFAIFGEAAFDIVPERLILTLGARYYDEEASQNGSSNTSFGFGSRGIYNPVTGTYSAAATPPQFYGISANLNVVLKDVSPAKYSGLLKKANLTFKLGDRSLVYATYSEGFRPGGFNRKPCNVGSATCPTVADFAKLAVYVPDEVKNYEIGAKFSLLDRSLQINLAAYQIDWSNIQITLFDQNISNQTFTTNLVDARIKGIEGDVTWRATRELTFNAAGSYNDSSLTAYRKNTVVLLPLGSPLSNSPKFQANIRMRYETELASGLKPYFQASFRHVGSSISSIIDNVSIRYPTFNATAGYVASVPVTYNGVTIRPGDIVTPLRASQPQASYNTFSAAIGVSRDDWTLELFAENLTDERPELYKSGNDGELRITTSRPRTIGMRVSLKM